MVSTKLDRRRGAFGSWRTSDILITAVIGVVFGVVFWAWNNLWNAAQPAFVGFPPAQGFMYGVWLIPAVLAPLVTRKAGAGLLAEIIAALVSIIFGASWAGGMILLYGVVEGLGGELGYALFRYRKFNALTAMLSGAFAGLAAVALDIPLYYNTWDGAWMLTYAVLVIVCTALVAGLASIGLRRALQSSGALPARRT